MNVVNDLSRSFSPTSCAVGKYDELWTHYYGSSIKGAVPVTFEEEVYNKFLYRFFDYFIQDWCNLLHKKRAIEVDYPLDRYVSLEMYEKHLRTLVECIKNDGVNVILLSEHSIYKQDMDEKEQNILDFGKDYYFTQINPIQSEYPSYKSLYRAVKVFNGVVEKVAMAEHVTFIDVANLIPKNLQNFCDDYHLTKSGSRLLAEIVGEEVIKSEVIDKKFNKK